MFDVVNEDNFVLFAAKHYNNPQCYDTEEFYDDLKRFKYVKRLLNRYLETDKISERLLLNHFIVIFNVFGQYAGLKLTVNKLDEKHLPAVKSFLLFLNYLKPNQLTHVRADEYIAEVLRKI